MSARARWIAGLACAAAGLSILLLPALAGAVFQGRNGKIAFVSGRGAGGDASADVYIIDRPNAPVGAPLTSAAGQHRHPNWSPDGRLLTYALWNGTSQEDIWVHDVVNGGRTNITISGTVREDRPAFSPDGTRVAYESEVSDGSGQQDILVTTLGPGGGTINLTSSVNAIEGKPVWSPDGTKIYYSRVFPPSNDHDIMREAADNSQVVPEFIVFSAAAEYQPSLSPDGKEVCYTRGPFGSNDADVYKARVASAQTTAVDLSDNFGVGSTGDYNCAYSPDGRRVAFVQGIFSSGALVHRSSDATGPVVALADDAPGVFDGNPDWARRPARCNGKPATIHGTDGDDRLRGTPGPDVIVGFKGKDVIKAGGGRDIVCAGGGGDQVLGGAGNDLLLGGPGHDRLNGGRGRDTCNGGPGKDSAKACEVKIGIP